MVQFVDSLPVASVLEEHNSIQAYFRKHRPDPSAAYGIKPEVMDTYVRSCGACRAPAASFYFSVAFFAFAIAARFNAQ
jgi:hypothetical protein